MFSQINLPSGMDEWHRTLSQLPETCQDIYFTPEYIQMHSRAGLDQVICLKYQEEEKVWAFPVLRTQITQIGNIKIDPDLFDLDTAYGYGGPLSNSENRGFLARANQAFIEWAQNTGIVAQFVRFHPMLENERWIEDDQMKIILDRYTTSTDLNQYNPGQPFYPKSTRNIINSGLRNGISARSLDIEQDFPAFLELYQNAMLRLGAEPYLFFNSLYFDGLKAMIKENGFLLGAFYENKLIAAAAFIYKSCWLHYHLSASDFDNRVPGATNILLDLAFLEARSKGLKQVHLGGGRTPDLDDSLLKFKKSMTTDVHRFHIGKRIYNQTIYENLVSIWKQQFPDLVKKYHVRLLCYHFQE
jgi:hypothetical protein